MIWLLLGVALALDLTPSEPLEGQCATAASIRPGEPLPKEVDPNGDGRADCAAVILPTSRVLDYERWVSEARQETRELERVRAELEVLRRPPPLLDRPHVARLQGQVTGAAAVLLGAWVVGEVTERRR